MGLSSGKWRMNICTDNHVTIKICQFLAVMEMSICGYMYEDLLGSLLLSYKF